jgi:hypothetical protein
MWKTNTKLLFYMMFYSKNKNPRTKFSFFEIKNSQQCGIPQKKIKNGPSNETFQPTWL